MYIALFHLQRLFYSHNEICSTINRLSGFTRKTIQIVYSVVFICSMISNETCNGQSEVLDSSLPSAKWLYKRGPFDPRPYESTLLGNGLIKENYFDFKNRLWVDKGISFGGYVSANGQWGSVQGPAHGISETLLLGTWEIIRKSRSAGRIVFGFAHDYTFGHPTTRKFSDNQRLVETTNDLDTDPELTFSTLGLLHWTHEWRTGPGGGWGLRVGQLLLHPILVLLDTSMMIAVILWHVLLLLQVEHNGWGIMI
jgi:hypothetical protein